MRFRWGAALLALGLSGLVGCGGSVRDAFPTGAADSSDSNGLTVKSGELPSSEVWRGHVSVQGEVLVPEGTTLTIERGCRVVFDAQADGDALSSSRLTILGEIYALGDADAPVSFIAEPGSRQWRGVLLEPTGAGRIAHARFAAAKAHTRSSSVQFQFCQFENARDHAALAVEASSPLVEDCRFMGNDAAVMCDRQASPELLNNTIAGNAWGVICDNGSDPIIERNFIRNNLDAAVLCRGASSPQVRSNNIMHNGGYAVKDGGRLSDNFIQGNNGVHPNAVDTGATPQGFQVNGVEEIVSARSSRHPEAGDRLFR